MNFWLKLEIEKLIHLHDDVLSSSYQLGNLTIFAKHQFALSIDWDRLFMTWLFRSCYGHCSQLCTPKYESLIDFCFYKTFGNVKVFSMDIFSFKFKNKSLLYNTTSLLWIFVDSELITLFTAAVRSAMQEQSNAFENFTISQQLRFLSPGY